MWLLAIAVVVTGIMVILFVAGSMMFAKGLNMHMEQNRCFSADSCADCLSMVECSACGSASSALFKCVPTWPVSHKCDVVLGNEAEMRGNISKVNFWLLFDE